MLALKNYPSIWESWFLLLSSNLKKRKEILNALHFETQKGFDVIARIAIEELEHRISSKKIFASIKEDLEFSLSLSVWSGYALFLIDNNIDPQKENLIAKKEINELGNLWIENYNKDRSKSKLLQIDPILSMFLEKVEQNEYNRLLTNYPKLLRLPFEQVNHISSYLSWSAHQGFILGILEQELINGK